MARHPLASHYQQNIGGGPGPGTTPWYDYPRIDNYGSPDPYGGFPKPDSNFLLPPGTPITALSPGTVTAVDNPAWGGAVTMQMDSPYNSIATHEAYIHLQNSSVHVGQHLDAGDVLGVGGGNVTSGSQKAGVGFAFYHGNDYGFGPDWNQYIGSPAQNPVNFLNQVKVTGPGGNPPPWCSQFPWAPGCPNSPGVPSPFPTFDPCSFPILQWFCPNAGINWSDILIRILLVVVGAMLVIVGFSKLFGTPTLGVPGASQQPEQQSEGEEDDEEGEDDEEDSSAAAGKQPVEQPESGPTAQSENKKAQQRFRQQRRMSKYRQQNQATESGEASEATEAAEVAAV